VGSVTQVIATSDLTGIVYFHWYLDGRHVGVSQDGVFAFSLGLGVQGRVEVLDTTDPDFDPIANAPAAWPATRVLWFLRSIDLACVRYHITQSKDGGASETIGYVVQDALTWAHTFITPRLDDLASYAWRIFSIDDVGNVDATGFPVGAELVVRTPDAPDFTVAFDPGTTKVTFTEAA